MSGLPLQKRPLVVLSLVCGLLYLNTLGNDFSFDDAFAIVSSETIGLIARHCTLQL